MVGGVLAIAQTVGVIAGSGIAAATGSIAAGYLTLAVVLVVTTLPYALDSRDIPLPRELRPPFHWRRFLRGFWVSPRGTPTSAWAWLTRFLMNLGNALLVLYLLYYLTDAVDLSDHERRERGLHAHRGLRRVHRGHRLRRRPVVGPAGRSARSS